MHRNDTDITYPNWITISLLYIYIYIYICLWLSIIADDDHILWFPSQFCLSWARRWERSNPWSADMWADGTGEETSRRCWMKAPLVLCCTFSFSVPYPLCLKVVDALGHCISIRHGLQQGSPIHWVEWSRSWGTSWAYISIYSSVPHGGSFPPQVPHRGPYRRVCWSPYEQHGQPSGVFGGASWMQYTLTPHVLGFLRGGCNLPKWIWIFIEDIRCGKLQAPWCVSFMLSRPHYCREGWKYILHGTLQLWFPKKKLVNSLRTSTAEVGVYTRKWRGKWDSLTNLLTWLVWIGSDWLKGQKSLFC